MSNSLSIAPDQHNYQGKFSYFPRKPTIKGTSTFGMIVTNMRWSVCDRDDSDTYKKYMTGW